MHVETIEYDTEYLFFAKDFHKLRYKLLRGATMPHYQKNTIYLPCNHTGFGSQLRRR